jgi:N-acetylneuraminate synthase/N,N'-diacetyllegionaminate synthase
MEQMIKKAAETGIDIIKWQTFNADKLNIEWPDYKNSYNYYKSVELSEDDHVYIIAKCKEYGIEPLFTAFDLDSAKMLYRLGMRKVKIASPDANNWKLIDWCLIEFKHIYISTGLHSHDEINELLNKVVDYCEKVTLLHCVSLYPTPLEKVNLYHMGALMKTNLPSIGFSDHSMGTDAAKIAMCLGASCIEKHFTLDRTMQGRDHAMSATVDEFRELVEWREIVKKVMFCPELDVDKENRKYKGRWNNAR